MASTRRMFPSPASAKNCDANHHRVESDSGHHPKTFSTTDRIEVARTEYEAFKLSLRDYLPQELPNHRARARQKLTKFSPSQFGELSMDAYDELVRRNESEKGAPSFLPIRDDFHPKRNQARQKLSTLPARRFNDLTFDVSYELRRRYPEVTEPSVKQSDELPRVPKSPPPPYEPSAPQVVVEDVLPRQSYLLGFVKKAGSVFGC